MHVRQFSFVHSMQNLAEITPLLSVGMSNWTDLQSVVELKKIVLFDTLAGCRLQEP